MKKSWIFIIIFGLLFSISSISALSIYLKPLSGTNELQPNTTFQYQFNLTSDALCTNVLYSNTTNVTTGTDGISFVDLDISSISGIPKYLCEYKGTPLILRKIHILSDQVLKNIYANNINLSGYIISQGYNLTNGYLYALNSSLWSTNYSNFSVGWNYALNSSLWSSNYSTYLTHRPWSDSMNNTLAQWEQVMNGTVTSGLITWANAINGTLALTSALADYYALNNPFGYYNSTSFSISDYYLKSNPFGYYNSTNPSPDTDTFKNNYSTYLLKPLWSDVMNSTLWGINMNNTLAQWEQVMNGTVMSQATFNTNYTANDANYRSFSNNYSNFTTGWLYATNSTGTLSAETLWNANYSNFSGIYSLAINSALVNQSNTFAATYNQTFDTNTLFIDAVSGRVGIGTTGPTSFVGGAPVLEIAGVAPVIRFTDNTAANYDWEIIANNGPIHFYSETAGDDVLTMLQNGNVGIGTTGPLGKLDIGGTGVVQVWSTSIAEVNRRNWGILREQSLVGDWQLAVSTAQGGVPATAVISATKEGNVGIGTTTPTYKLTVGNGSATNYSLISAYFEGNISSAGYITRTSTFNKLAGSALNLIQDSDYYKTNGIINHSKFYGYTSWNTNEIDYSKPIIEQYTEKNCSTSEQKTEEVFNEETKEFETKIIEESKETCIDVPKERTIYNETMEVKNEGVLLDKEIDLLRQAIAEIKICTKNSNSWDEYKICINKV